MLQKIIQIGNSFGITLSKQLLENVNLKAGDIVHVDKNEASNTLIISSKKNPLKGMSPDIVEWTQKFISKNRQALEELADK